MRLTHLTLTNFRNFARAELDLPPGISVFWGENAQGKTNLLEAIYLLATTRSPRAASDAELVRWDAVEDGLGVMRVAGRALRGRAELHVEVTVMAREAESSPLGEAAAHAAKRLRVNGLPRRASEVIGHILAVLFTAQDIDLLTGSPAGRRRYLDITVAQVDHAYLRALQRYQRVMQQRNVLLRRIGEGRARPEQLLPWNEELVVQGTTITLARAAAVAELDRQARDVYAALSAGREELTVRYAPQLAEECGGSLPTTPEALRNRFREALQRRQGREIAAGVSLVGPHRDDLRFAIGGRPAGSFGSRAQQRTAALALRLAEARFLRDRAGETPVLLLDDILSELDERRRAAVLHTLTDAEQAFITTAEIDRFSPDFLRQAAVFRVAGGRVQFHLTVEGQDTAPSAPSVVPAPAEL
jgi:DNA replication and repair protein RecF